MPGVRFKGRRVLTLYLIVVFCVHSSNGASIFSRAFSCPIVCETYTAPTSGLINTEKTDSGICLTQLSNIWRTNRLSSTVRMCLSQFIIGPCLVIERRQQALVPHKRSLYRLFSMARYNMLRSLSPLTSKIRSRTGELKLPRNENNNGTGL